MIEVCSKNDNKDLEEILNERDQMWRLHEKAQISFLQNQNAQMLSHLHSEIERLMNINRDLSRKLNISGDSDDENNVKVLESKLKEEEQKNAELQQELVRHQKKIITLEKTFERTINFYKEELNHHEDRIRQLTNELHDRTQTVTQLSTQLRSIKLREAIAQAQQRRRASHNSPKSPNSPVTPTENNSSFRLFGFSSGKSSTPTNYVNKCSTIRTASIKQSMWSDPTQTKENNIEKPQTLSTTFNISRPRHIASIRRTGSTTGEPL